MLHVGLVNQVKLASLSVNLNEDSALPCRMHHFEPKPETLLRRNTYLLRVQI